MVTKNEELDGSLKELLEQRFRMERELLDEQFNSIHKATKLQAAEYERRLESLNHAHEQARDVLNTYLPREAHEAFVRELSTKQDIRTRDEETKAENLKQQLSETRVALEKQVSNLAAQTERTRQETTARLEAQIGEIKDIVVAVPGRFVTNESYKQYHESLERQVLELKEMQSERRGADEAAKKALTRSQWTIGIIVVVSIALANAVILVAPSL